MNIPSPADLKGYALTLSNLGLPFVIVIFILVIAWRGVNIRFDQMARDFEMKLNQRGSKLVGTATISKNGDANILVLDLELLKTYYNNSN